MDDVLKWPADKCIQWLAETGCTQDTVTTGKRCLKQYVWSSLLILGDCSPLDNYIYFILFLNTFLCDPVIGFLFSFQFFVITTFQKFPNTHLLCFSSVTFRNYMSHTKALRRRLYLSSVGMLLALSKSFTFPNYEVSFLLTLYHFHCKSPRGPRTPPRYNRIIPSNSNCITFVLLVFNFIPFFILRALSPSWPVPPPPSFCQHRHIMYAFTGLYCLSSRSLHVLISAIPFWLIF